MGTSLKGQGKIVTWLLTIVSSVETGVIRSVTQRRLKMATLKDQRIFLDRMERACRIARQKGAIFNEAVATARQRMNRGGGLRSWLASGTIFLG